MDNEMITMMIKTLFLPGGRCGVMIEDYTSNIEDTSQQLDEQVEDSDP